MKLAHLLLMFIMMTVISGCFENDKSKGGGKVYRIGYMLCNSGKETQGRFIPLTRYLSEKTGEKFEFVPVDTHEVERRFGKGEFDFTHTNSLLYVVLKERFGVQLIASEKRGSYGVKTGGTIIASKKSGIKSISELKGKKFSFGPMLAPTGFLAEYNLLLDKGIDPEKDIIYTIPSGSFKHEKSIYGVIFGEYDAAAAPMIDLEEMIKEGKITSDDITVLAETPLIPYCTFAASSRTDKKVAEKLRKALIELKPETTADVDGERVKVLKSAWIDGYEQIPDSEYDAIRTMAKRAGMPPYQKY